MKIRTLALILAASVSVGAPGAAASRSVGETRLFTRVESPGMPEGIAVDHTGRHVYVGTNAPAAGNPGAPPSKLFVYSTDTGEKETEFEIQGQSLDETHGIVGLSPGKRDVVYVADRAPARVLSVDFSGDTPIQETYAEIPDLAPCVTGASPCSNTVSDLPPYPDGIAFDHDGNLYVSDFQQATIFKVPPGGGAASVWFTDQLLESPFGPNGIAIDSSRDTLYFAVTGAAMPPLTSRGAIYTLPVADEVDSGDLRTFFEYPDPAAGPDGIAFGKSGNLYVALAGGNAISVLSTDGRELTRFPGAVQNQQQEMPYDMPASIAFNDRARSILVTNHTYFTANAEHWAVLEAFVDDTALKLPDGD
jgi:sugar lactone lactonase YvrE